MSSINFNAHSIHPCPSISPCRQSIHLDSKHHLRPRPAPPMRRVIQPPNIRLPLTHIGPQHTPIIRIQAIHLALHVRRLRPHAAAARIPFHLLRQFAEDHPRAVIVRLKVGAHLVRLVNRVNGLLDVPQAASQVSQSIFNQVCTCTRGPTTHCSIETLCPMPPNSPWNPMRRGS